jgi:signal transduction histidine kinase
MRAGGRLQVRTRMSYFWREDKERTSALRITIADSGHGIGPEIRENLFEPFFTTKGINGTGLGLWISLNIVEKHGGLIQVHSSQKNESSGTVFSILLPTCPIF